MELKKENDILEKILSIAENGYAEAYRFLLDAYEQAPEAYGPQTLYFLACLVGGAERPEAALGWLRTAIADRGWWYRPEVLEDDDLAQLNGNAEFWSLKACSDMRYADAVSQAEAQFSWERKTAERLFLAVHGNTQNGQTAREDWSPILLGNDRWQLETVQSAEPDGYGTYRWSYDMISYLPVAEAIKRVQNEGYQEFVCGGFSAGCDALLRAVTFSPVRCDMLLLQSPWLPVLQEHADILLQALRQKDIAIRILCGSEDEDCRPMAEQLYTAAEQAHLNVQFLIQDGNRHQLPAVPYTLKSLL